MPNVFVLSVRIPLPPCDATEEVLSGFWRQILPVLSAIRGKAEVIYAGEEFEIEGFYHREWAMLIDDEAWGVINLNPDIFALREIISPEIFLAKYRDFILKPDSIQPTRQIDE